MSSVTQPITFADLYTDLLNRVREQTSVSATVAQAKRYINIGLTDMHIGYGETFPWAERKGRLTTSAPYTTGTVSVSKGSQTLTGSGTLWNTANSFGNHNARITGKIIIAGLPEVYDVSAVGGDTAITLGSAFVGTSQSAATYVYFEDEYDLGADFLRPLDLQFFDAVGNIRIIDRMKFRRAHTSNSVTGPPTQACIVDRAFVSNTTPVRRVQLWKPPDKEYSIPYAFVTNKLAVSASGTEQISLVEDADEPIVPVPFRSAIVLHALYNWYRDRKDDDRSKEVHAEYVDLMVRIADHTEIGNRRPSFAPQMGNYRGRAKAPYREGARGRWTLGTAFDRMGD